MSKSDTPSLKIGPMPDMTPVKMTVAVDPELKSDLDVYAELYERSYGEKVGPATLVFALIDSAPEHASDSGSAEFPWPRVRPDAF